jgi:hypothetical protein
MRNHLDLENCPVYLKYHTKQAFVKNRNMSAGERYGEIGKSGCEDGKAFKKT